MATGGELIIDEKFVQNLQKADAALKKIGHTAEATATGLNKLLSSLTNVNNALFKETSKNPLKNVSNGISEATDKANRFMSLMSKINNDGADSRRNSAVTKINEELEDSKKRLQEVQRMLNFYAKGEGKKAIGFVDTSSYQNEAKQLMNKIDLLEREKASLQANARLRLELSKRQEARDNAWYAMENNKRKSIQESAKKESDAAKQSSDAYKKAYEQRLRMYEKMFDAIDKKERKMISDAHKRMQIRKPTSSIDIANKEINNVNNMYSKGILSINNMQKALSRLREAQQKLNLNTEKGRDKYKELSNQIVRVQRDLDKAIRNSERFNSSNSKLLNITDQLARRFALLFSVSQISNYINRIVTIRKEFELQKVALGAILQSQEEANKLWNQTVQLAVKSPFRVKELITYTKQLAAYRIESDKLHDTTKRLADVSAGLGVDMSRLILAYGQVRAAEYLRGTELRQFTEAGIPMLEELAKYFKEVEGRAISTAEVFDMISKRMVTFADVEAVMQRMTNAGGVFYNMQEKQSQTLHGELSNLQDTIDLIMNDIGQSKEGVIKGLIKFIRTLAENWETLANIAIPTLTTIIIRMGVLKAVTAASNGVFTNFFANLSANFKASLIYIRKGNRALQDFASAKGLQAGSVKGGVWGLLIGGAIAAIMKLISVHDEHGKALQEINKKYEEMVSKVSSLHVAFSKAVKESDIKVQKTKLQELIDIANKEYYMNIKVDVEGLTAEDIEQKFTDIRQQIIETNSFVALFNKAFEESKHWNAFDSIDKDFNQLSSSYSDLSNNLIANKDRIISAFSDIQNLQFTPSEKQLKALEVLKQPIGDRTELEYVQSLMKAYEDLIDERNRVAVEMRHKVSVSLGQERALYQKELHKFVNWYDNAGLGESVWTGLFKTYTDKIDEAKKEFDGFIENIKDEVLGFTKEDAEIYLTAAINRVASEEKWSEFVTNTVKKWSEETFVELGINLFPKIPKGKDLLLDWQNTYNKRFEGLKGFKKITDSLTTQKKEGERLLSLYKDLDEQIQTIEKAGGNATTMGIGAYSNKNLKQLVKERAELLQQLKWFGIDTTKDKDKDKEVKILQNRINLINQLYEEYTKLSKKFSHKDAEEQVRKSFSDTFKEAFEGTGIDLSMYSISKEIIENFSEVGEKAGGALSEGVVSKLKELKDAGTYIRSATKDIVEFTKAEEAFRSKAYFDEMAKIWTIGYGTTSKAGIGVDVVEGLIIDQVEAEEWLLKTYQGKEKVLNNILDKHKDLILTQEQYNALLDAAYNGEGAKKAIELAYGSWEYFEDYLNSLKAMKQANKKAVVVNIDEIKNEWEALDTIQEKLALTLKWSGIRTGGKVSSALQDRAMRRANMFSGDLDIAKQLKTTLVEVAGIDFTNVEGVIDILKKLSPIAEKEGEETALALSRAISDKEVEIGVQTKEQSDKELIEYIEEMFDGYELSLELDKLGLPKYFMSDLFNIDTFDLDQIRTKIENEISRIKSSEETKQGEKDRLKELEKQLQKVDDMEEKQMQERLKKYSKYLLKSQSEAVKIKLDELRQIEEIESLQNVSSAQKNAMKQGVKDETQKKLDKNAWDTFKEGEIYIRLFEDLEYQSVKSLRAMRSELTQMRGNLKNLDPSALKEISDKIDSLDEQIVKRNPFKALGQAYKDFISVYKRYGSEKELEDKLQQSINDRDSTSALIYNQELDVRQAQKKVDDALLSNDKVRIANAKLNLSIQENTLNTLKERFKNDEKTIELLDEALSKLQKSRKMFSGGIGEIGGDISAVASSLPTIMGDLESMGIRFSEEMRDSVESISEIGQGVGNAIQGFASGNYLQGIMGVTSALAGIFKIGDKSEERRIQREIRLIEDLGRQYEKLQKQIDNAYSLDTFRESYAEAQKNLDEQIAATERMIEAEKAKKNTDNERIKEWQHQLEEYEQQKQELLDKQLQELGGFGESGYKDAAQQFVDAWVEAFRETGDGLSALEDKWDEYIQNVIRKQMSMKIANKLVEPLLTELDKALEDDSYLSTEELEKIDKLSKDAFPKLNEALQQISELYGSEWLKTNGELSGLTSGIQGVTEQTADQLAGLINSIRLYVANNNRELLNIANTLKESLQFENPMLSQLKLIATHTDNINTLLESVVGQYHSGGRGIKVIM